MLLLNPFKLISLRHSKSVSARSNRLQRRCQELATSRFRTRTHIVWVFQAMACLYDLFVWILPKIRHGTPERAASAKLFAFHHAIVIFLDLAGLPLCHYTYYCCGIGILEGTNFFLGIYRLSQHLGISKRHPFIVVDIACFWASCTVFRIALPLYQLARLYLDCQIAPLMFWKNRPRMQVVLGCIAILLYSVLTLMNFMWYYEICRKMYRAYGPALCPKAPRMKET